MSSNVQRLGEILHGRMTRTASEAQSICLELGTITASLGLTTDSIKTPIPKGCYMVDISLSGSYQTVSASHTHSGGSHGGHTAGDGGHTHSGGSHTHGMPSLKSGDRVLVAWCGNEPVVVAVVVSS